MPLTGPPIMELLQNSTKVVNLDEHAADFDHFLSGFCGEQGH